MYKLYPLRLYGRCSLVRVVLVIWLAAVIWNEHLVYLLQSWHWSKLPTSQREILQGCLVLTIACLIQTKVSRTLTADTLTVMFVADPQLIGLHDEPPYVGPLSRWDSDRYLQKTFVQAYHHIQPDVVIFLGDLLDEGSNASPEEYDYYTQRFHNVFNIPSTVKTIFVPGDNDVGGEGFDVKTSYKLKMFNDHFIPGQDPPKDVINIKSFDFMRVDLAPNMMAAGQIQRSFVSMRHQSAAQYRVLCSHIPIVNRVFNDQNEIIALLGADIIFSSHTHLAVINSCTDCGPDGPGDRRFRYFQGTQVDISDSKIYHMDMNNKRQIYDIQVPTCSYRMGVPNMGYSAATLDNKGHIRYTVLWSPPRYYYLWSYCYLIVITSIIPILLKIRRNKMNIVQQKTDGPKNV